MSEYWSYCALCKSYTNSPNETRKHHMVVHGRTEADVMNVWPDEEAVEA